MTDPVACPECAGLSEPGHPAGPLAGWHHELSCTLLAHEDGRVVADLDQLDDCGSFARDATTTELALLAALGGTWPDDPDDPPVRAEVTRLTPAVRHRAFPAVVLPADDAEAST